jgi:hypothetical protein
MTADRSVLRTDRRGDRECGRRHGGSPTRSHLKLQQLQPKQYAKISISLRDYPCRFQMSLDRCQPLLPIKPVVAPLKVGSAEEWARLAEPGSPRRFVGAAEYNAVAYDPLGLSAVNPGAVPAGPMPGSDDASPDDDSLAELPSAADAGGASIGCERCADAGDPSTGVVCPG